MQKVPNHDQVPQPLLLTLLHLSIAAFISLLNEGLHLLDLSHRQTLHQQKRVLSCTAQHTQ